MQTETLQATVVKLNNGGAVLKEGSYIAIKSKPTPLDIRKRLVNKGVIKWGINVDKETGRVLADIVLDSITRVAHTVFGTRQFTVAEGETNTEYEGGKILTKYYREDGSFIEPTGFKSMMAAESKRVVRHERSDTDVLQKEEPGMEVYGDLLEGLTGVASGQKGEFSEFIIMWSGLSGKNYAYCMEFLEGIEYSKTTINKAVKLLLEKNYMTEDGIGGDEKKNYTGWTLTLTNKGFTRYEELVNKFISEDKRDKYLTISKNQYEDDLKPESMYDFYTRMRTNESTRWGDTLAINKNLNVSQVLGMVTYYQTGLGSNYQEDCDRVVKESGDRYLVEQVKVNLEHTLTTCQQSIQQGKDKTEHTKNAVTLTQMLEVYEELVVCTM